MGAPVAEALGAEPPQATGKARNVLWSPESVGRRRAHGIDERAFADEVEHARTTLLAARGQRVPPAVDDKVIAGWNGLAIRALAIAGRALGVSAYIEAARNAAGFVWERMLDAEGRLHRSWRTGAAHVPAFLDDHALLGLGFLTLFETYRRGRLVRSAAIAGEP